MAVLKLRGLGAQGIITDIDPYDLPLGAFSNGVNLRFRNNKITSGPVFRTATMTSKPNGRFLFEASPTGATSETYIGYQDGTITLYANSSETDVTLAGYAPAIGDLPWTATVLDGVVYVNRSDRPPWYLLTTDAQFKDLSDPTLYATPADAWDPTWTTTLLRQCSNSLVALNVTKGALSEPNLVKTSAPVVSGTVPASWDITNPATLATETTLGSMDGPITDATALGSDLIIYGRREAWRMHADGSIDVFEYTKLPFKKGAISANCSVELDSRHYVFGSDDIFVHDGVSEQSICDQKTRDYIYGSMNVAQSFKNFVVFNQRLNELYFCYVSGDALTRFVTGTTGCNRAAVFNLTNSTWSFDDLPGIWFGAFVPLPNFQTYDSATSSYDMTGGSYQDQEDGDKRVVAYVGEEIDAFSIQAKLYAFDVFGDGSVVPFPVDTNATSPRYLERIGMSIDEMQTELEGYKVVSTIWPQARVDTSGGNLLMVRAGTSLNVGDTTPVWQAYQPFDGQGKYKVDVNIGGQWLAMSFLWNDFRNLTITGFDIDVKVPGSLGLR